MSKRIPSKELMTSGRDMLLNPARKVNWPTLLAGAAIGMIGVQLAAVRPTIQKIDRLEQQVAEVTTGMTRLAAVSDDVNEANTLLAAVVAQREQVEAARRSLAAVDDLHHALRAEVSRAVDAEASLDQLAALNTRLIEAEPLREETAAAIEDVERLQADVAALTKTAAAASEQIATADRALVELGQLKEQVFVAAETVDTARAALEELTVVQNGLIAAGTDTESSRTAAEQLVALQARILAAENLDLSAENAERMIALQDRLAADERLQLEEAARNMDRLITMQQMIADQTGQIADSIDGLELLTDFQGEMNGQLANLEQLRRQLTELILLETTVARAMEALEPLAELQDLRRLDQDEVREVARSILERRRERMASGESKYDTPIPSAVPETEIHRLVPEPPTEE